MPPKRSNIQVASETRRLQPRLSPVFQLMQGMLIHYMARAGMPTAEIAAKLDVDRSYVIRSTVVAFAPENEREARVAALAAEYQPKFQAGGLRGLLGGVDVSTTLAGGVRPSRTPKATPVPPTPVPVPAPAPPTPTPALPPRGRRRRTPTLTPATADDMDEATR